MATATQRAEQQGTRGAGAEGGRCTTRGIGALDGVCGASTPLVFCRNGNPTGGGPLIKKNPSQKARFRAAQGSRTGAFRGGSV